MRFTRGHSESETRSTGSTYGDTDTVDAQVTETKDTGTVCDDTDLGGMGPVLKHRADRLALLDGDVQSLGAGVDARVLETDVTNGGGIDEGHELAHVVHEQAVEEIDVLVLDGGEVQVLVDGGRSGVDHLHRASALGGEALHGVGKEAGEVLVDTLLGGERETCIGDDEVSTGHHKRGEMVLKGQTSNGDTMMRRVKQS